MSNNKIDGGDILLGLIGLAGAAFAGYLGYKATKGIVKRIDREVEKIDPDFEYYEIERKIKNELKLRKKLLEYNP